MRDPTSPWNIKVKKNTSYTIQGDSTDSIKEDKLPSLFLDALGGGKPKSPLITSSKSTLKREVDDDDRPPLNSIFSTTFQNTCPTYTSNYSSTVETTVTLIGFPPSQEYKVLEIAEKVDKIVNVKRSLKENGNWICVTFNSATGVERILEYDGKLIDDTWVLSVKVGELFNLETKERGLKPSPLKISKRMEKSQDNDADIFSKSTEPQIRMEKGHNVKEFSAYVNVDFPDEIIRPGYWNQLKDIVFGW